MATNNSINRRTQDLTIDPGSVTSSWIQYDINTANKFIIGVYQNAFNYFQIGLTNQLNTHAFKMTTAGECIFQMQPAFGACNTVTDSNVTGDGTAYTIICNNKVWDQNGDYNDGTGVFTAPVTGRYLFCGTIYLQGVTALHTDIEFKVAATSRDLIGNGYVLTAGTQAGQQYWTVNGFIDMTAADTASLIIAVSGSTKVVDVYGEGSNNFFTSFSGSLIC